VRPGLEIARKWTSGTHPPHGLLDIFPGSFRPAGPSARTTCQALTWWANSPAKLWGHGPLLCLVLGSLHGIDLVVCSPDLSAWGWQVDKLMSCYSGTCSGTLVLVMQVLRFVDTSPPGPPPTTKNVILKILRHIKGVAASSGHHNSPLFLLQQ